MGNRNANALRPPESAPMRRTRSTGQLNYRHSKPRPMQQPRNGARHVSGRRILSQHEQEQREILSSWNTPFSLIHALLKPPSNAQSEVTTQAAVLGGDLDPGITIEVGGDLLNGMARTPVRDSALDSRRDSMSHSLTSLPHLEHLISRMDQEQQTT